MTMTKIYLIYLGIGFAIGGISLIKNAYDHRHTSDASIGLENEMAFFACLLIWPAVILGLTVTYIIVCALKYFEEGQKTNDK